MRHLIVAPDAYVPRIKMMFMGVDFDLTLATLQVRFSAQ